MFEQYFVAIIHRLRFVLCLFAVCIMVAGCFGSSSKKVQKRPTPPPQKRGKIVQHKGTIRSNPNTRPKEDYQKPKPSPVVTRPKDDKPTNERYPGTIGTRPTTPSQPTTPTTPTTPPNNPSNPNWPTTPTTPTNPPDDVSTRPNEPTRPTYPDNPTNPEKPDEAYNPPYPTTPAYELAVMLPFNTPKYRLDGKLEAIDKKSKIALEFYEGLLVGLDKLKNAGMTMNVNIFDTENNKNKVKQILTYPDLQQADLILGPIYNKPLREAASFAQQNGVYLVSPLSPSTKITQDNLYYIMASPPIETHCAAIFDYMVANFGNKRIITVCNNEQRELDLANLFQNFAQQYTRERDGYDFINVSQVVADGNGDIDWMQHLSSGQENLVIMTTFDELLINNVAAQLNGLYRSYPITVFGMPTWTKMETLELEYLANLNLHLTNTNWAEPYSSESRNFKADFSRRFKTAPSKYAATAYDLILYFGEMLRRNGGNFGSQYTSGNRKEEGVYSSYDFAPGSADQYTKLFPQPDYIENKFVNIIRYGPNFTFEKVNR